MKLIKCSYKSSIIVTTTVKSVEGSSSNTEGQRGGGPSPALFRPAMTGVDVLRCDHSEEEVWATWDHLLLFSSMETTYFTDVLYG